MQHFLALRICSKAPVARYLLAGRGDPGREKRRRISRLPPSPPSPPPPPPSTPPPPPTPPAPPSSPPPKPKVVGPPLVILGSLTFAADMESCTPNFRQGVEGAIVKTLDDDARDLATVHSYCFAG